MTIPKSFEPVRQPCGHYPEFCPRNAVAGSDRCELHQQRVVAAAPAVPVVPPGALASPEAYDLAAKLLGDELDDYEDLDVHATRRLGRRAVRIRPEPIARQALFPFERWSPGACIVTAQPQRPFKPRGLMLWNAEHVNVEAAVIGNREQLLVAFGKVPGRWFMQSQTFEQVVQAVAEGKEPGQGWGDWDVLHPGMLVRLHFDAPLDSFTPHVQAVMWGLST